MGSSPLYEPIELLRDDGIRTYSAREIATGKTVLLYVFANALNRRPPRSFSDRSRV
jgi:hypothetical protein